MRRLSSRNNMYKSSHFDIIGPRGHGHEVRGAEGAFNSITAIEAK
jgi:hypothetical protein